MQVSTESVGKGTKIVTDTILAWVISILAFLFLIWFYGLEDLQIPSILHLNRRQYWSHPLLRLPKTGEEVRKPAGLEPPLCDNDLAGSGRGALVEGNCGGFEFIPLAMFSGLPSCIDSEGITSLSSRHYVRRLYDTEIPHKRIDARIPQHIEIPLSQNE